MGWNLRKNCGKENEEDKSINPVCEDGCKIEVELEDWIQGQMDYGKTISPAVEARMKIQQKENLYKISAMECGKLGLIREEKGCLREKVASCVDEKENGILSSLLFKSRKNQSTGKIEHVWDSSVNSF